MNNNDLILEKISDVHREVIQHILEEKPILELIQAMSRELGTADQVRARREFIETWMSRERDRAELRKAIIKHGTLLALTAIAIFVARTLWVEIVELIRGAQIK